jgi:hypothetical protein
VRTGKAESRMVAEGMRMALQGEPCANGDGIRIAVAKLEGWNRRMQHASVRVCFATTLGSKLSDRKGTMLRCGFKDSVPA